MTGAKILVTISEEAAPWPHVGFYDAESSGGDLAVFSSKLDCL